MFGVQMAHRFSTIDEVIAAFEQAVDQDPQQDRDAWLARYPKWADGLASYFGAIDALYADINDGHRHVRSAAIASTFDYDRGGDHLTETSGDEDEVADLGRKIEACLSNVSITKPIYCSGHSVVFLAAHGSDKFPQVIKVLRSLGPIEATQQHRFEREIRIVRRLEHPNIVRIGKVGRGNDVVFFTMPYYEFGSAADLMLRKGGVLPLVHALKIIKPILAALEYAHGLALGSNDDALATRGVLHRDIKPQNILLGRKGIVLADFGLAKACDASGITMSGSSLGTWNFMPREQGLDSKRVNPACDVWSVAATLYTMMTGYYVRDAYDELTPYEVVMRCPVVPIRERDASIPEPLAIVVDRALRDNVNDRISTIRQLRLELQHAIRASNVDDERPPAAAAEES